MDLARGKFHGNRPPVVAGTVTAGTGQTFQGASERRRAMLYWAAVFFVIAIVAAIFGFGGIAAGAAEIAKILFFVFLVIFAITLILGLFGRGRV
jgi:uncharacterized membrane protein YtjA (UPF0391 family)